MDCLGEQGGVQAFQAAGGLGERPVDQVFQVVQRVGRLGGPAPFALGRLVCYGLQLTQRMRVAQGVRDTRVGVIRRSCVMDRDSGEGRQHPGGVHARHPAPVVHGAQRVRAGGRRMHPVQPVLDPKPGLVEMRDPG